jgi:hypothetical protein
MRVELKFTRDDGRTHNFDAQIGMTQGTEYQEMQALLTMTANRILSLQHDMTNIIGGIESVKWERHY